MRLSQILAILSKDLTAKASVTGERSMACFVILLLEICEGEDRFSLGDFSRGSPSRFLLELSIEGKLYFSEKHYKKQYRFIKKG